MKIEIINSSVSPKVMNTFASICPAIITVQVGCIKDQEKLRVEICQKITDCQPTALAETGFCSAIISKIRCPHDGLEVFEIALFGNYVPAYFDIVEILNSYEDVTHTVYINDDECHVAISDSYYEYTETLFMDCVRYEAKNPNKLYAALDNCLEWLYTDSICPDHDSIVSSVPFANMLKVEKVTRANYLDKDSWRNPEVSVPAAYLFQKFCEELIYHVIECEITEGCVLNIGVKFDCCVDCYNRKSVLELLEKVDNALSDSDSTDWKSL